MDASYDKETILEAYLNTISFTDNTAGVAAEAEKLFGTTVDKLTLAQCASLAAITRSPGAVQSGDPARGTSGAAQLCAEPDAGGGIHHPAGA